jgi:hypothetical protein
MRFLFTILGIAARMGQAMSRFRINFIPFNWIAMGVLGILSLVGLLFASEGLTNSSTPRPTTLTSIAEQKDRGQNFVSIKGMLGPVLFSNRKTSKYNPEGEITESYAPFVDAESGQGMLVEMKLENTQTETPEGQEITLTGMLSPTSSKLEEAIKTDSHILEVAKNDKVFINSAYVLEMGRTPESAAVWFPVALLSGVSFLSLVVTFFMKYVVFQKTGGVQVLAPEVGTAPDGNLTLRTTGYFALSPGNGDRFLDVPTGLMIDNDGVAFLVANIDASNSFMGFRVESRVGYWTIPLGEADGRTAEYGRMYLGFGSRPAVKLPFVGYNGHVDTAIVTFGNEQERDLFINILRHKKGTEAPVPVSPSATDKPAARFDMEE